MHRIAIVGTGRLGARHLQGLGRLSLPAELHIVDPIDAALASARDLLGQVNPGSHISLQSHREIGALPAKLDLVIVATTADVRLTTLHALLQHARVGALVLEKVLFQSAGDYAEASKLLRATGTPTWVNCPRRMYAVYQELKEVFASDRLRHFDVWGGEWGLGSNAVHFLDLLAFLSSETPSALDVSGLDPGVRAGKRAGFSEYTGVIRGRAGDCSFAIGSSATGVVKHLVTLRGAQTTAIVDEEGGTVWRMDARGSRLEPVTIPYQSSLTGTVAEQLLSKGTCHLPGYDESMKVHLSLIPALAAHHGQSSTCAVT